MMFFENLSELMSKERTRFIHEAGSWVYGGCLLSEKWLKKVRETLWAVPSYIAGLAGRHFAELLWNAKSIGKEATECKRW